MTTQKLELTSDEESIAEVTKPNINIEIPAHRKECRTLTKAFMLDESTEPHVRCFYLHDGKVFFGVLLEEHDDSFLVGAPARLGLLENGDIEAQPVTSQSVIRLFKASIVFVTSPDSFRYHYFKYLMSKGKSLLPDYLKGLTLEFIIEAIYEAENSSGSKSKLKKSISSMTKGFKEELKGMEDQMPGASEDSFLPLVKSKAIH